MKKPRLSRKQRYDLDLIYMMAEVILARDRSMDATVALDLIVNLLKLDPTK